MSTGGNNPIPEVALLDAAAATGAGEVSYKNGRASFTSVKVDITNTATVAVTFGMNGDHAAGLEQTAYVLAASGTISIIGAWPEISANVAAYTNGTCTAKIVGI